MDGIVAAKMINFVDIYLLYAYRIRLYFRGINFCVFFQKSISWVLIFMGVIFVVMNCMQMVLFIPQLGIKDKTSLAKQDYPPLILK